MGWFANFCFLVVGVGSVALPDASGGCWVRTWAGLAARRFAGGGASGRTVACALSRCAVRCPVVVEGWFAFFCPGHVPWAPAPHRFPVPWARGGRGPGAAPRWVD